MLQVTMKMVKQLGPYELPSMLAFMPDEERRAFMKRVRPPRTSGGPIQRSHT